MWRSLFLSLGLYLALLGGECLLVERFNLAADGEHGPWGYAARGRELVPAPWVPWSLLSSGAVTILYSFTLPARVAPPAKKKD